MKVRNEDKSFPQNIYEKVVAELKASDDDFERRISAQLQLERELGLRSEEARKFNPNAAILSDGRIHIKYGTKGGRDRILQEPTGKMMAAIKYANQLKDGNNLIPKEMTERQYETKQYRVLYKLGISKKELGFSNQGLRHAFAHERYENITGFKPPCKFESKETFVMNAVKIKGDSWSQLDSDARLILKSELGYKPEREEAISHYLGSSK